MVGTDATEQRACDPAECHLGLSLNQIGGGAMEWRGVLLAALALAACGQTPPPPPAAVDAVTVALATVAPATGSRTVEITGTVRLKRETQLGFSTAGRIAAIDVLEGQRVVPGPDAGAARPDRARRGDGVGARRGGADRSRPRAHGRLARPWLGDADPDGERRGGRRRGAVAGRRNQLRCAARADRRAGRRDHSAPRRRAGPDRRRRNAGADARRGRQRLCPAAAGQRHRRWRASISVRRRRSCSRRCRRCRSPPPSARSPRAATTGPGRSRSNCACRRSPGCGRD